MGLFDRFKKHSTAKEDILDIPCDFDGYDFAFESGKTEPELYEKINNLVTNNSFDIHSIKEYKNLNIHSDNEEFLEFYDAWLEELRKNHFVVYLDNEMNITDFANRMNTLLEKIGSSQKLDVDLTVKSYKEELKKYTFAGKEIGDDFKYDILEANIVAGELRKIGYELICFFIGFDNNDKAVIKIEEIDKLKEIESQI